MQNFIFLRDTKICCNLLMWVRRKLTQSVSISSQTTVWTIFWNSILIFIHWFFKNNVILPGILWKFQNLFNDFSSQKFIRKADRSRIICLILLEFQSKSSGLRLLIQHFYSMNAKQTAENFRKKKSVRIYFNPLWVTSKCTSVMQQWKVAFN